MIATFVDHPAIADSPPPCQPISGQSAAQATTQINSQAKIEIYTLLKQVEQDLDQLIADYRAAKSPD